QASTTAGEKGPLVQGAVTTAAPTYTTAQTSPLSLNTAGGLRVDGSGVTQPVSGTVTANQGTANATPWNENIAQVGGTAAAATAKGTQAANGIGVQDLKDSGRTAIVLYATGVASGATGVETAITLTKAAGTAA